MANPQIPGQIENLTDERRLTNPIWYEWLFFVSRTIAALVGSWNAKFVPTVLAATGGPPTVTTATCRYRQIGKTIDIEFTIGLSALNGSTAHMMINLPVPPKANVLLTGREYVFSGKVMTGSFISGNVYFLNYDGSSPFLANAGYIISGTYEVA